MRKIGITTAPMRMMAGAARIPRTTMAQMAMGLQSSDLKPQLRDLKKLSQQFSQSILGQEQSTLLERRQRTQKMQRTTKNEASGTATTTAMMAINAVDPTNPSLLEDPPSIAVGPVAGHRNKIWTG